MSGGGDVTFKISRFVTQEDKNGFEEDLIPMTRVNCQEINEEGSILCDERGLYKIVFKNENRRKNVEVFYNIEFQPPEK
ncbi:hypothetical protein Avbf_16730 [Armadillidium vulgare]|nr:hypothetical protein Avbf_16730 [Armadillidium vulgare]